MVDASGVDYCDGAGATLLEGQVWRLYGDFRDPDSPSAVIDIELFLLEARATRQ